MSIQNLEHSVFAFYLSVQYDFQNIKPAPLVFKSFHHRLSSGCVSMGSMGSSEPMEFQKGVPEPMHFEHTVMKILAVSTIEQIMNSNTLSSSEA